MLPEGWQECRLGDLFEHRKEPGRDGLPILSVTMTDGLVRRDELDRKQESALSPDAHLRVEAGDIAYNTMRMWQGAFGLANCSGIVSPAYVVLKVRSNFESAYFAQIFRAPWMLHQFWAYSHGLTEDRLRLYFADFSAIKLSIPSSAEQARIAELLGTWDEAISVARELWAKRIEEAEILRESLIGAILQHAAVPLAEVADVRTGLAKGKTGQRDTIEVPYLRVANVQDGRLDLKEVKLIEVAREHVGRYSLQAGDVLMTEGGDFDKLGRGTVWSGEIDLCLHQNHVFAVRPKPGRVHSGFVAAIAASNYGRSYFMSCAKRSTNLASINSTQLKALPIPLVSMAEQERIVAVIDTAMQVAHGTQKMIDRLIQEKAALMADLLTGKRRVKLNAEAVSTP